MSRTIKGNLTGKAAHGADDTYQSSNLSQAKQTEILEEVAGYLQRDLAHYWAAQVAPVDLDKFALAMMFIEVQESAEVAMNGEVSKYDTFIDHPNMMDLLDEPMSENNQLRSELLG